MTEKEHHLYGGSSAYSWVNCHGWASLITQMPPDSPSKDAARGTALHTGTLDIKSRAEIDYLTSGKERVLDYTAIPNFPEEGPRLAEEFWDIVWKEVLEQFITGKTIYIEKKLMLFPDLDSGGTADFIVLYYNDKGKLVAFLGDCKFGKVRVEPDEEQLKFYLTALNRIVREKGKQIDEFRSFVYQPMHSEPFTQHKFTKSEIERAEAKYEKAIIESKKDKPKFKVGDWCTYCKAQGRCTAYNEHLNKEMDLMVIRNRDSVSFAPVETLSDETKAKIVLFSDKITKYMKAVKKDVLLSFMNGKPVAGLKVVEGRSNRVYKDELHIAEEMSKLGINPYNAPTVKGLGAMEEELVSIGHKRVDAKKIVSSFCIKPEGKPKITTIDDPKPDFKFQGIESLFEEYDDSE